MSYRTRLHLLQRSIPSYNHSAAAGATRSFLIIELKRNWGITATSAHLWPHGWCVEKKIKPLLSKCFYPHASWGTNVSGIYLEAHPNLNQIESNLYWYKSYFTTQKHSVVRCTLTFRNYSSSHSLMTCSHNPMTQFANRFFLNASGVSPTQTTRPAPNFSPPNPSESHASPSIITKSRA